MNKQIKQMNSKSVICGTEIYKSMACEIRNLQFAKRKSIICKMEICNFKNGMCNLQNEIMCGKHRRPEG